MKYLFTLYLLTLIQSISFSQDRKPFTETKEDRNITAISFNENNIILNNKIAYKYERVDEDFSIKTLDGVEIIKGKIKNIGYNKFESIITFLELGIDFYNPKIIGRNDLIFALCDFNVFNTDLSINQKKLKQFIERFDTLEGE